MKIKPFLFTLMKIFLIFLVFWGTIQFVRNRSTNRVFVNKYATSEVVYANGETAQFKNKNFGTVNKGDVVTVHLNLPEEPLIENAVLTFYIYHSVTEIWCGDTLLESYGAEIDARGDMVGNMRFLVDIPTEAWGNEITIILKATENRAFTQIKNLGIYPAKDAYQYYIDVDPINFIILFPLLLLGILELFIFLVSGEYGQANRKMLHMSLFIIIASLYFLTSKGVSHLFGLDGYIWTIMEFIAVYTIAIPILLWAYETEEKGTVMRRILGGAILINSILFLLATVLNFTNQLHYCALLLISNGLTFFSGILLLVFSIKRRLKGSKSDQLFFNGMCIMFITGLMDLFRLNALKYLYSFLKITMPSLLPMGVLFLLVYMLRSYMAANTEQQEQMLTARIESENISKMLDNTPAGICQLEPNEQLTITAANDIFYQIIDYTPDELKQAGKAEVATYLNPDSKERLMKACKELLYSENDKGEIELSTPGKNGEMRTVFARYYYDRKGSGKINVNVIDISDRKRMEDELRVSEERYKLALTQSGKVFFFLDIPSKTMRLSEELATLFGLPMEVDNMPDNFIAQGLVETRSVEAYRHFYQRIFAGEKSGDTIISCHMRQAPDKILWYKIAFTSIFDAQNHPISAVITYEDLMEQRAQEIAEKWKQLNLVSVPEKSYVIAEYNLTQNRIISQIGGLFAKMPEFVTGYDEINAFVLEHFVYDEDVAAYRTFLDRNRVLALFATGITDDSIEYRSLQSGSAPRWTRTSIQIIKDPYSEDILARLFFLDIHAEKAGQLEMIQNVEALKKELENSRIKVMINQMQPHFLYNALSAIQTIVKTDPDYAYQLIYDFTIHLRSSIKALSSDAPIPFTDELKNIKAYLNIEKMRFGDDLKVKYEIDCEDFNVIPLSIQPLAENAARHGVYPKGEEGGTITIRTYETVDAYIVEVLDDGVGFDVNEVLNSSSDSVGLKSLIFRLNSLMNADVSVTSEKGKGTSAIVSIPKEADKS